MLRKTILYIMFFVTFQCSALDTDNFKILLDDLKTIEIGTEIDNLQKIERVLIVGSSGSGKTTLIGAIQKNCKDIEIPKRVTTRDSRNNESVWENIYVDNENFQQKVQAGEVTFYWLRQMEKSRTEWYGFLNPTTSNLRVYSGNNAALSSQFLKENKKTLIIAVHAPDEVRHKRLLKRSSDLPVHELKHRVKASDRYYLKKAHLLIHNHGANEEQTLKEIVTLVQFLANEKLGKGKIVDLGNHRVEYTSRLFQIMNHDVRFSNGKVKNFQYVRRSPGVRVLLTQGDLMLVTKEWRTEINDWDYRLPGGKVVDQVAGMEAFLKVSEREQQELAKQSALKEIKEECGVKLNENNISLREIAKCGATIEWDLHFFHSEVPAEQVKQHHHLTSFEDENIRLYWKTKEQILELCLAGKVHEGRTSAFLMKYILNGQ